MKKERKGRTHFAYTAAVVAACMLTLPACNSAAGNPPPDTTADDAAAVTSAAPGTTAPEEGKRDTNYLSTGIALTDELTVKTVTFNTTKKHIMSPYSIDGKGGYRYAYVQNISDTRASDKTGIPEGDTLEVYINKLEIPADDHAALHLSYRFAIWAEKLVDLYGDEGLFAISTDNGESWSEYVKIARCELTGETVEGDDNYGFMYEAVSEDLLALAKEGDVITNIKILPYGEPPANGTNPPQFGAFRFCSADINGYAEKQNFEPENEKAELLAERDTDELRKLVVDHMNAQASIKWTPKTTFTLSYEGITNKYEKGKTYIGLPYTAPHDGSLEEFASFIDEDGVYTGPTDINDAAGNDCSSSTLGAWGRIYPHRYRNIITTMQYVGAEGSGVSYVGDIKYDLGTTTTSSIIKMNEKQAIMRAYAAAKPGDIFVKYDFQEKSNGTFGVGHYIMAAAEPTVVMSGGKYISIDESKIQISQHAGSVKEQEKGIFSSFRVGNEKNSYTFSQLYNEGYLPITLDAFKDGKIYKPFVKNYAIPDAEQIAKSGLSGVVYSNYKIITLDITVEKADGTEVFSKSYYPQNLNMASLYIYEKEDEITKSLAAGKYTVTVTITTGQGELEALKTEITKK